MFVQAAKQLVLALKANPNVLECLYTPQVEKATPLAEELLGMKSILWTLDSMDWADPIPESVAQRVLAQISVAKKGILLMHDIHNQGVVALPRILEELRHQQGFYGTIIVLTNSKSPADGQRARGPRGSDRDAPPGRSAHTVRHVPPGFAGCRTSRLPVIGPA